MAGQNLTEVSAVVFQMKVVCLPVSAVLCVNIHTSVSTSGLGKTQASTDTQMYQASC